MKKIVGIVSILILVVILSCCFVACNDAETYQKRLEKAGYEVEIANRDDIEEILQGMPIDVSLEWVIEANNGDDNVSIMCFADKEQAEAFNTILRMMSGVLIEEGYYIELEGSILLVGTEQGIKDAK